MTLTRRGFFFGAGAMALAASVPINFIQRPMLWGDGVHDDTEALNAFFRGEKIETRAGVITDQELLAKGIFRVTAPLALGAIPITWAHSIIKVDHGGLGVDCYSPNGDGQIFMTDLHFQRTPAYSGQGVGMRQSMIFINGDDGPPS